MNPTSPPLPVPQPVAPSIVAQSDGGQIAVRDPAKAPFHGSLFEGNRSWARYIAALHRYKWMMAGIVLAAVGLGLLASRWVKPQYVLHSTIWIAPETQRSAADGPMRGDQVLHPAAWPELLTSFTILDKVAQRMSLFYVPTDPRSGEVFAGVAATEQLRPGTYRLRADAENRRYSLSLAKGQRIETGLLGDSIGRSIGLRWRPAPELLARAHDIRFTVVSPRQAALTLRERLTASLPMGSNLLQVTLTGTDPQRANGILRAIVDEFVSDAAALKKRNLIETTRALREQLDVAAKDLQEAESALEAQRVRTITLPTESRSTANGADAQDPVSQRYFTAELAYDSVRRERTMLERTLSGIRGGTLDLSALNALPAVRDGSSELQSAFRQAFDRQAQLDSARSRYTDKHQVVIGLSNQVQDLRDRVIPRHAAALLAQLKLREDGLRDQVETTARQLREVPVRTIEEARLRRNVEQREQLYATLKTRFEEASLAEASAVADVNVLDAPVAPEQPSSNRAPFVVVLAAMMGLVAAGSLAFALDRLDPRFRYAEQASEEMGLEIIGAVPAARPEDLRNPREAMQLTEAFRTIRLNVSQFADASGRMLLTLTSPNAGDGKSMISANLAQSFADAGHRTLLIDGDIRRGQLDKRFEVDRVPGLLDYLDGTASLDDVLRRTSERFWLLPRGGPQARGPELLTSPVVPELMTELQRRFEVVIVDCSPLGAGIDPFVLGAATGNMLLVLRAGESNRKLAEAKLKLLSRLPIRMVGVVLNTVSIGNDFGYYAYTYSDLSEEKLPVLESKIGEFARRSGLMS